MTSAFPSLHVGKTWLSLVFLALLTFGNLRGLKESVRVFGIPVYAFLTVMLGLILTGAVRAMTGSVEPVAPTDVLPTYNTGLITTFLLLTPSRTAARR